MDIYSFIALLFAGLTLISALFLVRRHNKRLQEELLAHSEDKETFDQVELIRVQNPTEQDLQAYDLIEAERQQVWKSLGTGTSIAPKKISQLSLHLIQQIAAIYHPDIEAPEFQASIFDLLELNERIIRRLKEYLDDFPLNTIRDVSIQDILKYKGYYDRISEFDLVKLAKKHKTLYTIGQYAWMGYNALNPWYWGKKVIFTAGKEGTLRYLLTIIITVVGEESVLVYSKRNLKAKAVAVEKNIAFEMINMAAIDGVVTQEEYEIVLDFILNNPRLDDQVKVTLLKALLRKRPMKADILPDIYEDKERKRLLAEVERVAKADKLGILKKREALKALEESLELQSSYRTQLELAPHKEVHSWDLMQQNRKREEAILRLMAQAGSIEGSLPDSLWDYIIQRSVSYPLPFSEAEQKTILREATNPTSPDTLTNSILIRTEKERGLSEVLDALLWNLPFTRSKEEFYTLIVSALDLKKESDKFLIKRLEQLLPSGKLVQRPPAELLKSLYRLVGQDEQITALQETATTYTFITSEEHPKKKETAFWLCVTTTRILVLAAAVINRAIYQHHLEFQENLAVRIEPGKLYDTYVLKDDKHEIRLENTLFHSANLKTALEHYLTFPSPPKGEGGES